VGGGGGGGGVGEHYEVRRFAIRGESEYLDVAERGLDRLENGGVPTTPEKLEKRRSRPEKNNTRRNDIPLCVQRESSPKWEVMVFFLQGKIETTGTSSRRGERLNQGIARVFVQKPRRVLKAPTGQKNHTK